MREERCGQERDESRERMKVEGLNEKGKSEKIEERGRKCAGAPANRGAARSSLAFSHTPTFPRPPGIAPTATPSFCRDRRQPGRKN